jgi:hypothetical protein
VQKLDFSGFDHGAAVMVSNKLVMNQTASQLLLILTHCSGSVLISI